MCAGSLVPIHTELDLILSVLVESSGCEGGAKPVKMNYLEPLPVSSSNMTKLNGECQVQNERNSVALLKVSSD